MSVTETSITAARAAVYHYDVSTNAWKQVDEGISRVDLYMSSTLASFRIVGVSAKTSEVVVNSPVYKEMKYQRVTNLFHQWSDTRLSYGLNFASLEEAQGFSQGVDAALLKLVQPTAPAPPFVSHVRTGSRSHPSRASSSSAAAAAAAAAKEDDIPPPPASDAPKPPPVTAEDLSKKLAERTESSAASGGSGAGSGPGAGDKSSGKHRSDRSGSRVGASKTDIEALKVEMQACIKKEVEAAKREILEAISRMSGKPVVFPPPPPALV